MEAAGHDRTEEQAAGTTAPPHSIAQQPNSDGPSAVGAAMPQPLASPAPATLAVSSPMNGVVTTAESQQQEAHNGADQPTAQSVQDANKPAPSITGPGLSPANTSQPEDREHELRREDPMTQARPGNSMPSGTAAVATPQHPPPPTHAAPRPRPLQLQGTQGPQQLLQQAQPSLAESNTVTPAPEPASASAPAPAPALPAPAAHAHHGIPHPQPLQQQPQLLPPSHQRPQHPHSHPHPHPPPPQQQQQQQQQAQHALHPQQSAPHPPTHAQIPHQYPSPSQHQQQHPHHQYQHHQPPPPPPPAPQHHHHHHQPGPNPAPHVASVTHATTPLPSLQQPHVPQFHSQSHHQPQPQPQQVLLSPAPQAHHRASLSKPIIMDPPSSRKSGQAQQQQQQQQQRATTIGFPSPSQDHAAINSKFVDDCTRMNYAIQQSLPEAVRRIVRDHWEKCLLGSEFHQAFVLNASIHHALPTITQRAVRDFGSKMVSESKHELMAHFTTEAFDEVADLIISKASDAFLDRCMEKRLLTIEAQPLINALAKAERLGYEAGDVIQSGQNERVIPKEAYPGAAVATNGHRGGPAQPQPAGLHLQCLKCFRTFAHTSAFDYHAIYDVCRQAPPTASGFQHSCPHCGQGFINVNELQDHLNSHVCGKFGPPAIPPAIAPQTASRLSKPAPAPQPSPTATIPPASQTPTANSVPKKQPQPTPGDSSGTTKAAGTPGSTGSGIAADPYGHLTEQQIQQMKAELREAEEKYAPRFAEANAIPDENARRVRLDGIRNSFGTKQSMIRKKYGVRLRERRTKAEIMAERERMGLQKAEKEKAARAAAATSSQVLNAASRPASGTGWTAANSPRPHWEEHDVKRRRIDDGGGYRSPYKTAADETPTRKPLSVSEIGSGLSGAAATAATHDPTLPPPSQPTKVYEQSGARVEIHEPAHSMERPATAGAPSDSATPSANGLSRRTTAEPRGSSEKPLVIDDDDSSSDDDEDIPSTLPAHVRKSLASGSTSLLQTN